MSGKDWEKKLLEEETELKLKRRIFNGFKDMMGVVDSISIPVVKSSYNASISMSAYDLAGVYDIVGKIKTLPLYYLNDRKEFVISTVEDALEYCEIADGFIYQVSFVSGSVSEKAILFSMIDGLLCKISIKANKNSFVVRRSISRKDAVQRVEFDVKPIEKNEFSDRISFRYYESSINYAFFNIDIESEKVVPSDKTVKLAII